MTKSAAAAVVPDLTAEARWREWQDRGAAQDRLWVGRMRTLFLILAAALSVAFISQL
jgi:hypothetical protein